MKISIFLSYPKPCFKSQADFIEAIQKYLESRGLIPRCLGVTDYDANAPLTAIRRLMLESNGLLAIAFRRTFIEKATSRYETDLSSIPSSQISNSWLTSPWPHIEVAMAFQLGLPVLILRESGVIADGVLEKGVVGTYMPEFDLSDSLNDYLDSSEWKATINQWEGYVRSVVEKKGSPPRLY